MKDSNLNTSKSKNLQPISDNYYNGIHKLGKISSSIMIILLLAVPISIMIIFGVKLDMPKTIKAVLAVFSIYGIVSIVEFIAFTPLLGAGGIYLSFVTGNVTNLKLPAALSAMSIMEVEPGSEEGELVSLIAIAVSSFVTSLLLFLGMLVFSRLEPILNNPTLAPAFNNLMPALLGSLAVPIIKDNLKNSALPIFLMAALTLFFGYEAIAGLQFILLPIFLVISVAWAYFLFKQKLKKQS